MASIVPKYVLLLVFIALINRIESKDLTAGAAQCFKNQMEDAHPGQLVRRVKLHFCDTNNTHLAERGYPFENLEVRVGNVLFNTNPRIQRTVLMKNTQVQICMFGQLDTNRLRTNPARLQISAHGKPQSFPEVAGVKINLPDLGIDASFCDLTPDGCAITEPACSERGQGQGKQDFCSCSTLTVPDYAPAGTDVEVTWKLLEIPTNANPGDCEENFPIDDLRRSHNKETLACLKIEATVKACNELSTKARSKIQGC